MVDDAVYDENTPAPHGGGRLLVVGTPIGNLGDLTPRAIEAFSRADVICCEDTRVTAKLLAHAGVSKPLMRLDENVIAQRTPELVDRMAAGTCVEGAYEGILREKPLVPATET